MIRLFTCNLYRPGRLDEPALEDEIHNEPEFIAEVSLTGYCCDDALIIERIDNRRFRLRRSNGAIEPRAI